VLLALVVGLKIGIALHDIEDADQSSREQAGCGAVPSSWPPGAKASDGRALGSR
jgi:hypothetical protein